MKITEQELREMIRESVKKKIATLNESSDFTAKRKIVHSAQNASMEFENEIKASLNLINPDDLDPHLQKKYYEIASEMQEAIVQSVVVAVGRFATLPRVDSEGGNKPNA